MFSLNRIADSLCYLVKNGYNQKQILDLARTSYSLSNRELKIVTSKLEKRLAKLKLETN